MAETTALFFLTVERSFRKLWDARSAEFYSVFTFEIPVKRTLEFGMHVLNLKIQVGAPAAFLNKPSMNCERGSVLYILGRYWNLQNFMHVLYVYAFLKLLEEVERNKRENIWFMNENIVCLNRKCDNKQKPKNIAELKAEMAK